MRNKAIKILLIAVPLLITISCKKRVSSDDINPQKAVLTFPAQNAVCTTGTILSATQSSIMFTWSAAANAETYELDLKNLLTGVVTAYSANTNQLAVTATRNTPYSWYVISKTSQRPATAQSETWKFYNSGVGVTSHSPFPADAVSPVFGANVTVANSLINLGWTGSDVDNDIAGYDVYLGTTATPGLYKSNVTDMFLNNVAVTSGTTYYWKIVTKDSLGNTSDSEVFQFKVN